VPVTTSFILFLTPSSSFESEGFDRPDMELPGHTNRLVSAILDAQPNTIVVNQSGSPVAMPWADQATTILQAFYGGNELGNGLADVLFGKVNPSGKLALTFPRRLEDNPTHPSYGALPQEHGKMVYGEGIFVGYRSYEARHVAPLFAFGHGLSYTSFTYSDLAASAVSAAGEFTVSVTVTNSGSVPGREAALVFVSDTVSSLPRPARELKGFKKTRELGPGEKDTLEIKLDRHALAFWEDRRGTWLAEPGEFVIRVGDLDTKVVLEKELAWVGL
jgi:beta-glucosidase